MPRPPADRFRQVAGRGWLEVTGAVGAILLTGALVAGAWAAERPVGAAATTTVTVAPPSTSASPTSTTAPTVVAAAPATTVAGPTPRASRRVATAVSTEKIRATSVPLRTMGVTTGIVIAALAATGFVYGRVRSRIPAVAVPRAATTPASAEQASPSEPASAPALPPPAAIPLPPPMIEDAVSDTVIFEPPPSHRPPEVITETPAEETDAT